MKKVNLLDIPKIKTIKALANQRLVLWVDKQGYMIFVLCWINKAFDLLKNEAFFKANVCQTD